MNVTSRISSLWPLSVCMARAEPTSQTMTVRSMLPERRRSPPKLNWQLLISPACPAKVRTHCPVLVSHALTVLSNEPVMMRLPL